MTTLVLVSKEGDEFEIPTTHTILSTTIQNFIDGCEDERPIVPTPNVESEEVRKVIQYLSYYCENPEVSEAEKEAWESEFVIMDQTPLFKLILAANYLGITPLLDLTAKTVADMIKGKTPEEIRRIFNIPNDFSPEEEEEIRRENAWCEDR